MTIRTGHYVTYHPAAANLLGRSIRAIVRNVHNDGTVTVEAAYELDEDGQAAGRFLGDTLTLDATELHQ